MMFFPRPSDARGEIARDRRRRQSGVAAIAAVGLVMVAGAAALIGVTTMENTRADRVERVTTTTDLETIREAIVQFGKRTGRLPCPADGTADLHSDAGATEVPRTNIGTGVNAACDFGPGGAMVQGVVPWRTLGLQPLDALDKWGNRISYRVYEGDPGDNGAGSLVQDYGVNFIACAREMGDAAGAASQCTHNIPRTELALTALIETQRDETHPDFNPLLANLDIGFLLDQDQTSQTASVADAQAAFLETVSLPAGTDLSTIDPGDAVAALGGLESVGRVYAERAFQVVDDLRELDDIDPASLRRAQDARAEAVHAVDTIAASFNQADGFRDRFRDLIDGLQLPGPGQTLGDALNEEFSDLVGAGEAAFNAVRAARNAAQKAEYQKLVEWFRQNLMENLGVRVIVDDEDVAALEDDFDPNFAGQGAGFVLISHGENQLGAWTLDGERRGGPQTDTMSTNEQFNATMMPDDYPVGVTSDVMLFQAVDYRHATNPDGTTNANAFDDIVQSRSVLDLAENAFRYINTDNFDPSQWSVLFRNLLFNAINVQDSDEDIITIDEDFDAFESGGSALGAGEISITALPDGTQVLNFGAQINIGDPFGPGDEVGLSNDKTGCVWIDEPVRFQDNVLRAYWEFRIYSSIDRANSADGFTFAVVPGSTQTDSESVPCGHSKIPATFGSLSQVPDGYDPPIWSSGRNGSWPLGRYHKPSGSDLAFVGAKWLYDYDQDGDPNTADRTALVSRFSMPKVAIEFDTYDSYNYNPRNDPRHDGTSYNHIAILRENTTIHCDTDADPATDDRGGQCGNPNNDYQSYEPDWGTNPWCPDLAAEARALPDGLRGCAPGPFRDWMEDRSYCNILMEHCCEHDEPCPELGSTISGCADDDEYCVNGETVIRSDKPYAIRVEMRRQCNSDCSVCGTGTGGWFEVKAWADCSHEDCDNVLKDFSLGAAELEAAGTAETLDYCMVDPGVDVGDADIMDEIKMGFTIGTGGFRTGMQLTGFAATNANQPAVFTVPEAFSTAEEFENLPTYGVGGDPVRIAVMTPESGSEVAITLTDPELAGKAGGIGDYGGTELNVYRVKYLSIENAGTPAETVSEYSVFSPVLEDRFGFETEGASWSVDGTVLRQGLDRIADIKSRNGRLRLTLSSDDTVFTQTMLNDLLQRITYENTSANPDADGVILLISFRDGPEVFNQITTVTTPVLIDKP